MRFPSHKTKIIATIGPACRNKAIMKKMIEAGMSVARLNFSHGSLEEHAKTIELIRKTSEKLDKRVAILGDLPGVKIRVGNLKENSVILKKGERVILTTREIEGDENTIPVEFKDFPKLVSIGDIIYLSDGYIALKVENVRENDVECLVINGGVLFSHKGINIPKANLPIEAITKRDLEIIEFGIEHGIDAIGISFVGSVYDVLKVKRFIEKKKSKMFVISKIERPDAVRNFDEILNASDGIMVARGDLGVEMPIESLPILQKQLIKKANMAAKPVITATQMLVSMTQDRLPTRAEVTDVANAILDGTDGVMLSEETAVGKYPVEAVEMMGKIAKVTEEYRESLGYSRIRSWIEALPKKSTIKEAITRSIIDALCTVETKYILTPTKTGLTARLISRFKPKQWILAFSTDPWVCNTLMFSYGVYPFCMEEEFNENDMISLIKSLGLVDSDDIVLLTEGKPIGKTVGTNAMKIFQIP
ncbi:pyruvate kinase [Thermococcus argininiproducens]|uniref:Pyruvate kinase n=1 Tax=Thermococcus argininiproducens TaxID=2866384 RepID=A0A9E7SCB1_9EURY|nr:pyruvate kinase [Thermococcus argininiproducens]USG99007.1 pyruvate kinase [Thermococcus argininiproducens]